jgi:purine-nucleoside phosphorylase
MPKSPLILTALSYEARALSHLGRVQVIGIGAARMSEIDLDHTSLIVIAGLAGALDPALRVGDVVIDERSTVASGERCRFHCSSKLIATPAEKLELFHATGARVVDMESDAVFGKAQASNVPYLSIRAISDIASDPIDPAIFRMTNRDGSISAARVLTTIARRPSLLRQMLRLRANSSLALHNLADALQVILGDYAGSASEKNRAQLP